MKNQLTLWRIERGLSQWELAGASGVPRWAVQLIECGHRLPSPGERTAIACALAVDENHLFPSQSGVSQERRIDNRKGDRHDPQHQ